MTAEAAGAAAAAAGAGGPPVGVAIAGAGGRMGRMLIEAVLAEPRLRLTGALDVAGSPALGQDAGGFAGRVTGVPVVSDLATGLAGARVLIDFTRPEGTLAHLDACRQHRVHAVIGTTGFSAVQKAQIGAHAQHIGVVFAPNMSVGVNVMLRLVEQAAVMLGPGYDLEVVEAHHRHKVDAPSGTALALGEALARGRGVALEDKAVFARHGHTGERVAGSIGFAAVRGGDLVGEHTVMYIGEGERIEIRHQATTRAHYAQGSLRAALFVAGRASGLYDMADVLGPAA